MSLFSLGEIAAAAFLPMDATVAFWLPLGLQLPGSSELGLVVMLCLASQSRMTTLPGTAGGTSSYVK